MAPSKAKAANSWDDNNSDEDSTPPSSPPVIARRSKFDDEEDATDSDVLESWDAAEDSEAEREKAKKAAEAKAKADALAKANHKSKSQRIEEKRQENLRRRQAEEEGGSSSEEEDEGEKRARLRAEEKAGDMKHAEDLFGGAGSGNMAGRSARSAVVMQDGDDPAKAIDLNTLSLFSPSTPQQFATLRDTLVPTLTKNAKKPHYALFLQEFSKQLAKDLNSDQLKKMSSAFATMSNERLKEEKAADKGGKKTKAAKTKTSLSASRGGEMRADTTAYDEDGLDDGDFM